MESFSKIYRVGLLLCCDCTVKSYELPIGKHLFNICFENGNKYCDLVITDKEPDELNVIPDHKKDCHGTTIIINTISSALLESRYEAIFKKGRLKYKTLKSVTEDSLCKLINSELVKHEVKEGQIPVINQIFNKHTRRDLIRNIFYLSWLLVPFVAIVAYLLLVRGKTNYNFLCSFVDYAPDCKQNILEEMKILALLYSIFNLKYFYDYILSIFDNINNDIFQFNTVKRLTHKILQFMTPLILFASALIIVKALFVVKYSSKIAEQYSFINIGDIFNKILPYLKDDYLIYYFTALDCCLLLITVNFFMAASQITQTFASNRQNSLMKSARKSFGCSILVDISVIGVTYLVFDCLIKDTQSKVAIQLIFLQAIYLFMNIATIFGDFKYE